MNTTNGTYRISMLKKKIREDKFEDSKGPHRNRTSKDRPYNGQTKAKQMIILFEMLPWIKQLQKQQSIHIHVTQCLPRKQA